MMTLKSTFVNIVRTLYEPSTGPESLMSRTTRRKRTTIKPTDYKVMVQGSDFPRNVYISAYRNGLCYYWIRVNGLQHRVSAV